MSYEAWGDENPYDAEYDSWSDRALDAGWFDPDDFSPGAIAILKERERQETQENWTSEHDDAHDSAEMAEAAACYALANNDGRNVGIPAQWPWDKKWWKPSADPIRNLEKAGALIAAEIDRLKRAEPRQSNSIDNGKK